MSQSRRNLTLCMLFSIAAAAEAQHPSGISNRVLIAVQLPTGAVNGNPAVVPQFALQIADATNNTFKQATPNLIGGWGTGVVSNLENLPTMAAGLVQNEDGSAALLNYNTENVTTLSTGISTPNAGTLITQNTNYVFVANNRKGQLTVVDRTNSNVAVPLSLPGVMNVSADPGNQTVLAFAQDSSIVYYVRKLSGTNESVYANGNWPTDAQDCEPFNLPTFCLMRVNAPGTNVTTFSVANFDHPVKAITALTGGVMFVLNGGPEADGISAGVTVLPVSPLSFTDGVQTGTESNSLTRYATPGGADNAVAGPSNTLYVAGQGRLSRGLWGGQLSTIDLTTGNVVTTPMADGYPMRMALADDNTLWIGSIRCNTGANRYGSAQQVQVQDGCLTVVNTQSKSVAWVEPWLCPVESTAPCSTSDYPSNYEFDKSGGAGDVTGVAPITNQHKVYYVEHGQVHIRQTTPPYSIIPNAGVSVAGVAVDIVYMDAPGDNDATTSSTTH